MTPWALTKALLMFFYLGVGIAVQLLWTWLRLEVSTMIGWFDAHDGFCTILLTLALVGVTWWYAKSAKDTVAEMHRQREDGVLPIPELYWSNENRVNYILIVANAGLGPAMKLRISGKTTDVRDVERDEPERHLGTLGLNSQRPLWTHQDQDREHECYLHYQDVYGNNFHVRAVFEGRDLRSYDGPTRV